MIVETQNFKFMKELGKFLVLLQPSCWPGMHQARSMLRMPAGLKKPAFLPDFGKEKRKALLDRFYTNFDRQASDHTRMHTQIPVRQQRPIAPYGLLQSWWCCVQTYDELLADNFEIVTAGDSPKPYSKQGACWQACADAVAMAC